jgi:hypothetical protein
MNELEIRCGAWSRVYNKVQVQIHRGTNSQIWARDGIHIRHRLYRQLANSQVITQLIQDLKDKT